MTKEQLFFLSTLADHINNRETIRTDGLDWSVLSEFARIHQLEAIFYHQCKSFIPDEYYMNLNAAMLITAANNVNRQYQIEELIKLFDNADIKYFFVKGVVLDKYYPINKLRAMGDADIVVFEREKAHEIMINNHFINYGKTHDREWEYQKNNCYYDLHNSLIYDEPINTEKITEFLSNFKNYVKNNELDINYHFIYVLLHLRKHFMNQGVGFRQFFDVAVFAKNEPNLDWKWIQDKLAEMNVLGFAQTVFAYAQRWFDVKLPLEASPITDEDEFEMSTRLIFKNGVFGFENKENSDYLSSNKVRNSKHPKLSMVSNSLRALFPSKKDLLNKSGYDFLKTKPFLLPIAWIKRIFKSLFKHGFSHGKDIVTKSFVGIDYVEKREEIFTKWKLN